MFAKVKVFRRSKIGSDLSIKTCQFLKWKVILKIPSSVCLEVLITLCWLQNKTFKANRFLL